MITSWFLGLILSQNGVLDDCFDDLSHAVWHFGVVCVRFSQVQSLHMVDIRGRNIVQNDGDIQELVRTILT